MTGRVNKDHRKSDRAPVSIRIDYSTVDEFFWDFARNINEGGLFVESNHPLPIGTRVQLKFYLPNRDAPLNSTGEVVWVKPLPDPADPSEGGETRGEKPGMGIEFRGLNQEGKEAINRLVRELKKGS